LQEKGNNIEKTDIEEKKREMVTKLCTALPSKTPELFEKRLKKKKGAKGIGGDARKKKNQWFQKKNGKAPGISRLFSP